MPDSTTQESSVDNETADNASPIREITIEGGDYFFSPATLAASPGERLRIVFVNRGQIHHAYDIDELRVHTGTILSGQSETLDIVMPTESVTYRSYCSIPGHTERGMVGQLIVES